MMQVAASSSLAICLHAETAEDIAESLEFKLMDHVRSLLLGPRPATSSTARLALRLAGHKGGAD